MVKVYEEVGYSVVVIDLEVGKEVIGKYGEKVKIEKVILDVDVSDFDVFLISGGFFLDLFCVDDCLGEFVKVFVENKKFVFVICYGL